MMPIISRHMALTPVQKSIAIAIPVLLGSLGRIPLGILTDRFGGRIVFSVVMVLSIIPAFLMGGVSSYGQLLAYGFLIGIALASFSVGVAFVNWMVSAGAARLRSGRLWGRKHWAIAGCLWFAGAGGGGRIQVGLLDLRHIARHLAGDLRQHGPQCSQSWLPAKSFAEIVQPLNDKRSWVLSLYYFLTFGGFVAMAVYLPTLLTEVFKLTPQDAGFRTAGFVVLATALRPVGGVLADKIGGRTILKWVFPATAMIRHLSGLSTDVDFHHWRAGYGRIDRPGQRSSFQTCT